MRISDWSSDVCSSDLLATTLLVGSTALAQQAPAQQAAAEITQPSVEVTMHPNYAAAVGRSAYAWGWPMVNMFNRRATIKIGRASCRERGCQYVKLSVVAGS